eukprot:scaffold14.g1232.t1
MAELLKKLGSAALKPRQVGEVWHKASISAKRAAKLRKEALLAGREWPFDAPEEGKPHPYDRKLKGHKWDKTKEARQAAIQEKLAGMDERIAAHRAARRDYLQGVSLLDRLLLTPKQIREKTRKA